MTLPTKAFAIKYCTDWVVGNDDVSDYDKDSKLRSAILTILNVLNEFEKDEQDIKHRRPAL